MAAQNNHSKASTKPNRSVIASEERTKQSAYLQPSSEPLLPRNRSLRGTKQSAALVPKLRFKEFEGEWEHKKLREITKINQGLQIAISERFTEEAEGLHFYITNEFLRAGSTKKYFIKNPTESVLCTEDDILMTRTGNTGQVVTGVKGAFHNNFFKIKFDSNCDKWFLYYFLTDYKTQHTILKLAGTSTIPDLNHGDFYRLKINLPNLPEQQKIANFLTAVDTKLQQLTKKKVFLEVYKKGVMQQLFSQQLRFKPDASQLSLRGLSLLRGTKQKQSVINETQFPDWEEKRLGEVSSFLDGRRKPIKSGDRAKMKGNYPYYGASGIIDYVNSYLFDEEIILLGEDGENIISRNLPLAFRVSGKCWVNNHAHVIKPKKNIDINFLTYTLERINYVPYNTGTAQPKLNQKVCKNIELNLPSLKEQQKIATYLSAIDAKIELVHTQITKTQGFKNGLLQGMFV